MRRRSNYFAAWLSIGSAMVTLCWPIGLARSADAAAPPPWAFAANPPGLTPPPDDGTLKHVPDSTQSFTLTQIRDLYRPPDWHPEDHPPMPEVVGRGRNPGVYACGYCHLPNGLGRPENANLAGLPASYIVQQMADFKSGARKSGAPHLLPQAFMLTVAAAVSDAEIAQAAQYFSKLKPQRWISVIETESVPNTEVKGWMLVEAQSGGREPIGQRIIEMPKNLERTELRDARSGFIAYVPVGSLEKGAALVAGTEGKTIACTLCHGEDLRGLGPVPALAGRSPSYLVRQIYDLQRGTRNGNWAALMQRAVAQLTLEDMVAIAAYTASLAP